MDPFRKLQRPVPSAQAFVACREIWHNDRNDEFILVGPISLIPVTRFPAEVRVSVYALLTGGHGDYPMGLILRSTEGDEPWRWDPPKPLQHSNPLILNQVTFHDLLLVVPAVGRYDLILVAGGQEIASQPLLIGPREAFRLAP
jgi:hypothetical protein